MRQGQLQARSAGDVAAAVKAIALGQLADGGVSALSINAIGRELGVSGPALYRYFAGRDDLLTALIVDAYDDLADHLRRRVEAGPSSDGESSLAVLANAYRTWALSQPHRYRLLFRAPVLDYDPHAGVLVSHAQQGMKVFIAAVTPEHGPDADARAATRAVMLWTRLHGLVCLEMEGNFASMNIDPAPLYAVEAQAVLTDY